VTTQEILAIIAAVSALIPGFEAIWQKISDNSSGTVRPLADILAEADSNFQGVITAAQAQLAAPAVEILPPAPTEPAEPAK